MTHFEVRFYARHDGKEDETIVFRPIDIMDLNASYADEPAHQAAMLAFVNGKADLWMDTFGRYPAYWRRLKSTPPATDEHLQSNSGESS